VDQKKRWTIPGVEIGDPLAVQAEQTAPGQCGFHARDIMQVLHHVAGGRRRRAGR
jgi:hypothetical protein